MWNILDVVAIEGLTTELPTAGLDFNVNITYIVVAVVIAGLLDRFLQPMVMHLACVNLRMSMPEVLCAGTINAAAALGKSSSHGSIEVGKVANLLVLDAHRYSVM